jgi:hypothetical protein
MSCGTATASPVIGEQRRSGEGPASVTGPRQPCASAQADRSVGAARTSSCSTAARRLAGLDPATLSITADPAAQAPSSRTTRNLSGNTGTRAWTLDADAPQKEKRLDDLRQPLSGASLRESHGNAQERCRPGQARSAGWRQVWACSTAIPFALDRHRE